MKVKPMSRAKWTLATLLDKEQQSNPEFALWGTVIEIAWYDATIRNDARAKQFFFQSDSVFEDIATMWALPVEAIREKLRDIIEKRQTQKHIDGRRYGRANATREPAPPVPTPMPGQTPDIASTPSTTGWRSYL